MSGGNDRSLDKANKMKNILVILLLLTINRSVYADTFNVGGKDLNIPSPQGFSRVTEQMPIVYMFGQLRNSKDQTFDMLAIYIAESDIPAAMLGAFPSRYFMLKVYKELKDVLVTPTSFIKIKNIIKNNNKKASKNVTDLVMLDPHYDTNQYLAQSFFYKENNILIISTVIYVNVSGKILCLFCNDMNKNLEWTQNASKNWVSMIMDSNSQSLTRSSASHTSWNNVFEKGIVGGVAGGLIGLLCWLFSKLKRRKTS